MNRRQDTEGGLSRMAANHPTDPFHRTHRPC